MKKTFSLKLMLLGLLIGFGSIATYAANFFVDGGIVYEKVSGGVSVAGVTDLPGTLVIPSTAQDNMISTKPTYDVVGINDDWYDPGKITWTSPSGESESVNTKNLTADGTRFILKIDAAKLTKIKTEVLQPLNKNITKFIVTAQAGLTNIPAFAFANVQYTKVVEHCPSTDDPAIVAKEKEIKELQKLLGTQIEDIQFCGGVLKEDGNKHVYQLAENQLYDYDYVVLGGTHQLNLDSRGETAWNDVYSAADIYLWKIGKKTLDEVSVIGYARERSVEGLTFLQSKEIYDEKGADAWVKLTAVPAKNVVDGAEVDNCLTLIPGLRTIAQEATDRYNTLKELFNNTKIGRPYVTLLDNQTRATNALTKYTVFKNKVDAVRDAWKDAGYRITKAVEKADPTGLHESDELPVYEQIIIAMRNQEFPNVTVKELNAGAQQLKSESAQYVRLDESGNPDGTRSYQFLLYEPVYETLNLPEGVKYLVDIAHDLGYITEDQSGNLIAVRINTGTETDPQYIKVKENTNGNSAGDNLVDNTDNTIVYGTPVYAESDYTERTIEGAYYKPSFETVNDTWYALKAAKEQADKELADFRVTDPDPKMVDEDGKRIKYSISELEQAVANAKNDMDTKNTLLATAGDAQDPLNQNALANLQSELDNLKKCTYTYEYNTDDIAENTTLTGVEINNEKIVTFGESCFNNCTAVTTDNWINNSESNAGKFNIPATTTTIGANAFKKTHINAFLHACNAAIESIGSNAFNSTETTHVNLKDATKIKNESIGNGVWDNTPLVAIDLTNTQLTEMPDGLARDIRRAESTIEGCGDDFKVRANTTLTTVKLPLGLTKFKDQQFVWCLNLNYLSAVPATVTSIGAEAFRGTAIQIFDLKALKDLAYVGDKAFANITALTKVEFAAEAPFENLQGSTFECDNNLNTVVLNDDIVCLPAGIFKGTSIQKLDLSKTQIEIVNNLFQATPENPNNTLVEVILPEEKIAADGITVEIPGVKIIMDYAFANLQALKGKKQADDSYRFEIPSSVVIMRPGVFFNDIALEEVYAMDSRLTNLGIQSFQGCASLKKFTFVTLEAINSTWTDYPSFSFRNTQCNDVVAFSPAQFNFDDMQFFGCPTDNPRTTDVDERPIVVMTQESYDQIKAEYWNHPSYDLLYSQIEIFQPTVELTQLPDGKFYGTYYNADYGTWVPMSEGKVYTAYQDGGTIYAYSAKHNNGYYKIPAAGSSTYIYDTKAKYAQGSAAVLIVSDHKDVKVERHSTMYKKNHSTLDIENELRVTAPKFKMDGDKVVNIGYPLATTTADFIYKFSYDEEGAGFFHWVTKPDNKVVPAGKVVFPMSDYQGTANPNNIFGGLTGGEIHSGYPEGVVPARLNIVFVDDDMSTGIKEYIQMQKKNDGAIYNLQGVRVTTPVKGQMYIQNGVKFIQK